MKRSHTGLLGWFLFVLPLYAQEGGAKPTPAETPVGELTDPVAILKKLDEATKRVKSVRYTAELSFGGSLVRGPNVKGTAILAGESEDGLDQFRFEIKVQDYGQQEVREYVAGSDGRTFFMIDHKNKVAREDVEDFVLGNLRELRLRFGMREFIHPEPFSDEIHAQKAELIGSEKIGNVDCYKIHIVYASGLGEARWWVGKTDFLPRAAERLVKSPTGEPGSMTLKITELTPNPTLPPDVFKLTVPDGYRKESAGIKPPPADGKR